jgi:hypothetical protein
MRAAKMVMLEKIAPSTLRGHFEPEAVPLFFLLLTFIS